MRLLLVGALALGAGAQSLPKIGAIDFYGNRRISAATLQKAMGVREGEPLTVPKGTLEDRLDKVKDVVDVQVTAVCCAEGGVILYAGVEERGAPHFEFRALPDRDLTLPEDLLASYRAYVDTAARAAARGAAAEDLTAGHPLAADPDVRAFQESFRAFAAGKPNLKLLREVLEHAADPAQREAAAALIGYAKDKPEVVKDLLAALKDSHAPVRQNAVRALSAFAVLAKLDRESELRISPVWFVEMLNSLVWTDRQRAAQALLLLTENRDPLALAQLRERARESLFEMARWKHLPHALPAFLLLGRAAGLSDAEIQSAWENDREKTIAALAKKWK